MKNFKKKSDFKMFKKYKNLRNKTVYGKFNNKYLK